MRTAPHPMALRIAQFVAEGRIIKDEWHGKDEQGRELACLLGAADPNIKSSDDCPADLMPQWLAFLTTCINDEVSEKNRPEIIQRYAELVVRWHVLDDAAWKRCEFKKDKQLDATILAWCDLPQSAQTADRTESDWDKTATLCLDSIEAEITLCGDK